MIRRACHLARPPRLWRTPTPYPRPGRSLDKRYWLAARAHARLQARRSSPERTAPAIADSRTDCIGTARLSGLPGTPRRSRARTDRTSRSSPVTCQSAARPGAQRAVPLIAHHVTSAVCGSAARPLAAPLLGPGAGSARHPSSWSRLRDAALRRSASTMRPSAAKAGRPQVSAVGTAASRGSRASACRVDRPAGEVRGTKPRG